MGTMTRRSFVAAMCLGVTATAWADEPEEKPKGKLEIRRAETKAAEGLTEARVPGSKEKIYLHKEVEASNADIAKATVEVDKSFNPAVGLEFTKAGAKKMAALSADHMNKPLAILIDGKVVTAPVIRAKLADKVQITGNFSKAEVEALAKALNTK